MHICIHIHVIRVTEEAMSLKERREGMWKDLEGRINVKTKLYLKIKRIYSFFMKS